MKLKIATSQFPVSADIKKNTRHILRQMQTGKDKGADVIHFPEAALSGYAGVDLESYEGFDWDLLRSIHPANYGTCCSPSAVGDSRIDTPA